jgi:hypothetical protein
VFEVGARVLKESLREKVILDSKVSKISRCYSAAGLDDQREIEGLISSPRFSKIEGSHSLAIRGIPRVEQKTICGFSGRGIQAQKSADLRRKLEKKSSTAKE